MIFDIMLRALLVLGLLAFSFGISLCVVAGRAEGDNK